jgi:hypothetical protein
MTSSELLSGSGKVLNLRVRRKKPAKKKVRDDNDAPEFDDPPPLCCWTWGWRDPSEFGAKA